MTPDTLTRLEAPLHHLIPHSLLLFLRQLGQRRVLADLVELTVVDGHGFEAAAAVSNGAARARRPMLASVLQSAS